MCTASQPPRAVPSSLLTPGLMAVASLGGLAACRHCRGNWFANWWPLGICQALSGGLW